MGLGSGTVAGQVELVHLMAIDVYRLSASGRGRLLALAGRERSRWLAESAAHTRSAVVLVTEQAVELYTSDPDYLRFIAPQVRRLTEQTKASPEYHEASVIAQSGPRALHHLMNYASGLWTDACGAHRAAVEIQRAADLAKRHHTLCPMLSALLRTAAKVGERVAHESALHDPRLSAAARELEGPDVDRIIEEEIAEFKLRSQSIPSQSSVRLAVEADRAGTFERFEPISQIRLRIAVPVEPQIRYLDAKTKEG